MHEHIQCEHEIKYCKVCDVCYCEKCQKEWRNLVTMYSSPTTWVGDGTYPYTITAINHGHGKDLE